MSKTYYNPGCISRRDFLKKGVIGSAALLASQLHPNTSHDFPKKSVVSIVKIKRGTISGNYNKIKIAVREAIRLLGGIDTILAGKEYIMLKPNLVADNRMITTNPEVVRWLADLIKESGKRVVIGEGSAVANGYNIDPKTGAICIMNNRNQLNHMQQSVFEKLDYTDLANSLNVPLINLHTGKMVDVLVPNGLAYNRVTIHHSLTEIDLLCSVPMMKTHNLASVTLGMKNLIGLYPGIIYGTVRSQVHDHALKLGSEGFAFETIDMVRANKLGLVVIDASTAMEGEGPSHGDIVQMNLIIAGTNPLATDMVAASVMDFKPEEIPMFVCAHRIGMHPQSLDEIEIRGESISSVRRHFKRPTLQSWADESSIYSPCQRSKR